MTATHTHRNDRPSLLAFGAAVAIGTTFLIISLQHVLLASKQPKDTLMGSMLTRARGSYLRSHPRQDFMPATDLSGQDGFFSTDAVAKRAERDDLFPSGLFDWHDEFFSPFLESPFLKEFQRQHHMMMEPAFKMNEDGDQVSLVMSIPDVPLKDIDIEVVGGRVIHIQGETATDSSHVSFDKRFSIGQHLNESNLKAKLTRDGDLVVTAPKVGTGKKDEVRKIPIQEEL